MNHFYAYFTAFRSLKSTLSIFATRLTLTMKYRLQNAIYPFIHKFPTPREGGNKKITMGLNYLFYWAVVRHVEWYRGGIVKGYKVNRALKPETRNDTRE